ncbi:ABC transporter ATP-binding protein [Jatrophihabitans fulvus]
MAGISVRGLSVGFSDRHGTTQVLHRVDVDCAPGRMLGVVGESGSGKTTLGRALGNALADNAVVDGHVEIDGVDVLALRGRSLREWRASSLAVVHQEAGASLDPTMRVGAQLAEVLELHGVPRSRRRDEVRALLERVRLPADAAGRHPFQLSGGQQQRVVIAAALAGRPRLLLLDEPTTGLDASVEAGVLALIEELRVQLECAVVLISHDLGLVGELCDDVTVLHGGRVVEQGRARDVLTRPQHECTQALLRAVPRLGVSRHEARLTGTGEPEPATPPGDVRLDVRGLRRAYRGRVAVDGLDVTVRAGEVLGLVGESGSGKSTLARAIAGLGPSGEGELLLDGETLAPKVSRRPARVLPRLQMVFQQPDATLNPAHTTERVLARAVRTLHGTRTPDELADWARLEPSLLPARTTTLSGGQKQRVAIARAFAGSPELVVLDEPVSALDVSVQAELLDLLADTAARDRTAYLFVSHDLAVISYLADRVAVMYRGQVVETGTTAQVIDGPHHPYTAELVAAAQRRPTGEPTDRDAVTATGCRFADRCPFHLGAVCDTEAPPLRETTDGHAVRCHLPAADLPVRPKESSPA